MQKTQKAPLVTDFRIGQEVMVKAEPSFKYKQIMMKTPWGAEKLAFPEDLEVVEK